MHKTVLKSEIFLRVNHLGCGGSVTGLGYCSTDLDPTGLILRALGGLELVANLGGKKKVLNLRSGPAGLPVGTPWGTESA